MNKKVDCKFEFPMYHREGRKVATFHCALGTFATNWSKRLVTFMDLLLTSSIVATFFHSTLVNIQ